MKIKCLNSYSSSEVRWATTTIHFSDIEVASSARSKIMPNIHRRPVPLIVHYRAHKKHLVSANRILHHLERIHRFHLRIQSGWDIVIVQLTHRLAHAYLLHLEVSVHHRLFFVLFDLVHGDAHHILFFAHFLDFLAEVLADGDFLFFALVVHQEVFPALFIIFLDLRKIKLVKKFLHGHIAFCHVAEEFLCVRSGLGAASGCHMFLHLLPVFAIDFESF